LDVVFLLLLEGGIMVPNRELISRWLPRSLGVLRSG
jgi:hypothetical protein